LKYGADTAVVFTERVELTGTVTKVELVLVMKVPSLSPLGRNDSYTTGSEVLARLIKEYFPLQMEATVRHLVLKMVWITFWVK